MELGCSLRIKWLMFCFIGTLLFATHTPSFGQCEGEFKFEVHPSPNNSDSGQIEVKLNGVPSGTYTVKLYSFNGGALLLQTEQLLNSGSLTFVNLKPAAYLVKIEWGESCFKVLGGIDGIIVTEQDQER